jgi:serine/threonine protein kinase
MAVCPNCGNPSDGKRFCSRCGTELSKPLVQAMPADAVNLPPASVSPLASGALAGRSLDQRYYLESRLGAGGMGTVYRARRLLIGDTVAVKVLHPELMADSTAVERFRREAQTAARLKHPNVVTVYDFGVSKDGLAYLVMELVEGESLGCLIGQQGILPEATAAEILRQVCAAMDEAHRQGVVHRDIKPDNILVQMTPCEIHVKVVDFGIAAVRDITASKLTRTGGIVGTIYYMSPEQCLGEKLDGRSDIYGLGVILFEMLTGVLPFNSPTPTAVVVQQVTQAPPLLRTLNANISPAVEAVVLHALEKQREARPQTAGDLARELIAAVNGMSAAQIRSTMTSAVPGRKSTPTEMLAPSSSNVATLLDAPPTFGEATAKTGSGSKFVLLLFGALLLLAAGVGGGIWWYTQRDGTGQVASTNNSGNDSAKGNQQPTTVGDQATARDRGTSENNSTPSSTTKPLSTTSNLWEVILDQTSSTTDAANALGAADQQMAVIKPGGQLALAYREGQFFGDGDGADLRVYGPEQGRVSYLIFVRDNPDAAWERIDLNRKGFPQGVAGHDMGHHGVRQARQIMIKNNGNADLSIDAITAIYKEVVSLDSRPHHHH